MRALDLFSGIGGIALAAHWAGIETAAFCEIEPYCQQVLSRHWPTVPIYTDVHGITRECLEEDGVMDDDRTIDIVLGGYPCQPFSSAGKRKGETDDRHLWPEMFRVIQEIRPRWVVGENVAGHVTLGLDSVLTDLESEGYTCRAFLLPAASVGAPHKRERVFIVAHATGSQRRTGTEKPGTLRAGDENRGKSNHPDGSGAAQRGRKSVADTDGIGWDNGGDNRERRQIRDDFQRVSPKSDETRDEREHWSGAVGNVGRSVCESVAYPFHSRVEGGTEAGNPEGKRSRSHQHPQRCNQLQRGDCGATKPGLGGASDGVPAWMDGYRWPAAFGEPQKEWEAPRLTQGGKNRRQRLQALGNAVVPQQIYPILKAIADYEEDTK